MDLILGTAQLVQPYGALNRQKNKLTSESRSTLVLAAERLGFIGLDTAPSYGNAEKIIGKTRTSLEIHTKLRPRASFLTSLEESKRRLRVTSIDLVYVHDSTILSSIGEREIAELESLGEYGVARLGASIYDLSELNEVLRLGVFETVQVPFNVLDRRFNAEMTAEARTRDIRIFIRSIFLQGVLLANPADLPAKLNILAPFVAEFQAICDDWGVERIDALANFAINRSGAHAAVVGASSGAELERIQRAFVSKVPDGLLEDLDKIPLPIWEQVDPRKWS